VSDSSIYYDAGSALWLMGTSMIKDDAHDLGWASYRGRRLSHYNGRHSPNHDSPVHHWMIGTALCLSAQVLGALALYIESQDEDEDENLPVEEA